MNRVHDKRGDDTGGYTADIHKSDYIVVGNMNVGKTTLFERLSGSESSSINIPGTTIRVKSRKIKGLNGKIYDTPGIFSIFSSNEDEKASRDILLVPAIHTHIRGLILVADAKNLKRSIAIALQYAEFGLPMLFNINMVDESSSRGIEINTDKLSHILGMEVCTTIAREGIGVDKLKTKLENIRPSEFTIEYSDEVEKFIDLVEKLLKPENISSRALGLLFLVGDTSVKSFIRNMYGHAVLNQLNQLVIEFKQGNNNSLEILFENLYHQKAGKILKEVVTIDPPTKNPFILTFGDLCTQLSTGIPIALAVVAGMYLFVGTFAATFLVDTINMVFFEGFLIPLISNVVGLIPNGLIQDLIMDPDFGVLPTGVFLALGLVLPVIFCFYIAFGVLEDSGYLPRISMLLDRIFKGMGLNGKGVIPLVMGFSCVTMSILTTRILNTEKEKNIACFLVFLCMPCAPLIAVMLVILDKMPFYATIIFFSILLIQFFLAGFLANKILPGQLSSLIMEIPVMRVPKPLSVIKMAAKKSYHFMKEAIPVFIYASVVIFIFQRIGGLEMLERLLGPFLDSVLGLPEKSIQVFIKTMIRRESGAAELGHLSGQFTNLQLITNLLVMTLLAPCINAIIVLFKERGVRAASSILCVVIIYAFVIGSIVNHFCRFAGITFT
ncbi:MAG: ferrous iron transporter B [Desulfobacteraceae bacterium]|nr:ferrous iron transporter B [Desulfobacteraceae bacterium]